MDVDSGDVRWLKVSEKLGVRTELGLRQEAKEKRDVKKLKVDKV